jgi:hypothetical protein
VTFVPLDHVQSLAAIEALPPEAYAAEVAAALPADLEARDAALAAALAHIDATAIRIMRIRLDHALANDTSIGAPTRRVFAQTVVAYVADLDLLARRALDVAARGGAGDPAGAAQLVVDAARATLVQREALSSPVLSLVRDLAAASVADADRRARDRTLDDAQRRRWSAIRRELEALAADPARVATPFAQRLATWPAQLDEPAPEAEPTFAELLELD